MFAFRSDPTPGRPVGVAFTDREGGVSAPDLGPLNLGRPEVDPPAYVARNYDLVRAALGLGPIVAAHQVHGADVLVVDDAILAERDWGGDGVLGEFATHPRPLPVADALVTTLEGVALSVRVADCVPVALADARAGVIGVAHAGRVGLAAGVLEACVAALRAAGGREIEAWIGPHVCGRCYEVPAQLADAIGSRIPAARGSTRQGTPSVDLAAGATAILESLGCTVSAVGACTLETTSLHSHRRDGERAGRMAGFVWLAAPGA